MRSMKTGWKVVSAFAATGSVSGSSCFIPLVRADVDVQAEEIKKMIKPSQLPIYEDPTQNLEYEIVLSSPNALQDTVSVVRTAAWKYANTFNNLKERVVQFCDTGIAHTRSTYAYLTDDAHTMPRAVAITIGGLGGLLASARGGFIKKLSYSGIGMLGMASLCYPRQSVDITQRSYQVFKTEVLPQISTYKDSIVTLMKKGSVTDSNKVADRLAEEVNNKVEEDIGQSNPEDKDMYTTRGS